MHGPFHSSQLSDLVYDLRRPGCTSDGYYSDISWFSDVVLAGIEVRAGAELESYSRFVQNELREVPRSHGEYAMEMLTLGMAFSRYLGGRGEHSTMGHSSRAQTVSRTPAVAAGKTGNR